MNGRQVPAVQEARFGGVDWSWERHAVCVVDAAGAVIERFEVEHQAAGLVGLVRRLRRAGVARVAIERGDGPVVEALLAGGLQVVVISSRQVKALRLRYGTAGNKDDRFDAFVLADVLRSDGHRLAFLTPDSPATVGLRALVRARKDLVKHRIALGNQLRANLLTAFPGAVGLFAEIDSPISLTFLTRFSSVERAAWLSDKRLAAWLVGVGYCGRRTPEQLMAHLRDAPAGLTGPAGAACATVTEQLVATLTDLRARIDVLDERIAETLALHHDAAVFTSLPRAGTNRAALLLAEIGDCRARFPTTRPWLPRPGSHPPPGPAADATTSPSGTAAIRSCARHSSTSPPTAARPTPGPPRSTSEPATAAPATPTRFASSPGPGAESSGAAGPTTPPTTPTDTAPYNNS
jgi:transposase